MDFVAFGATLAAITTLINSIVIVIALTKLNKLETRISNLEYREWNSSRE